MRILLALVVLVSSLLMAGSASARTPLSEGAAKLTVGHDGQSLTVGVRGPDGETFSDDEVVLHVAPAARTTVPPTAPDWLGPEGSDVWILPQDPTPGLLGLGWSAADILSGTYAGDEVELTLNWVEGPGSVQAYDADGGGEPRLVFDSSDGVTRSEPLPAGSAGRLAWALHAEGVHTVNLTVRGETPDGNMQAMPVLLQFYVGDLDDAPPEYIYIDGPYSSEYLLGETVSLTAKQVPESRFTDFRWGRRCHGEDEPTQVAAGPAYAFTTARADDGCEITLTLHDDDGQVIGTAYPMLISVGSGTYGPRRILSKGHTDVLYVSLEADRLRIRLKDDTGEEPVLREPGDVLLHAKPQSAMQVSEEWGPSFGFLGEPGDTFWLLPEVQEPNLLWPGWETVDVPTGAIEGDALRWRLLSVDGPGAVKLFVSDPFGGAIPLFDSDEGLPAVATMNVGTHTHANWAFTEPGLYKLRFDLSGARTGGGGEVSSQPVEYWYFVGDLADLPPYPQPAEEDDGIGPPSHPGPPTPDAGSSPPQRARFAVNRKPRVGRNGTARVARVRCPAGPRPCTVSAPRRVTVKIAGRKHRVRVLAPRSVRPGGAAWVRVRLPARAVARLRRAKLTVRVAVSSGDLETVRRLRVFLRRR